MSALFHLSALTTMRVPQTITCIGSTRSPGVCRPFESSDEQSPLTYAQSFNAYRTADRHRIMAWTSRMVAACDFKANSMFLDVGCGVGRFTATLARNALTSVGVDKDPEMIAIARHQNPRSIHWLCASADSIPMRSSSVNIALASMLLEHVRNKEAVLCELGRLLAPNGTLLLRTMLPIDIEQTTWYDFLPLAATLELRRTLSLSAIRNLATAADLRVFSCESFRDKISPRVAGLLPARIRARSYDILRDLDDQSIEAACHRITLRISAGAFDEYMSSSLLVIRSD